MKRKAIIAGIMAIAMSLSAPLAAFAQPKYVFTPNPYGYPWDVAHTEYFAPVKSLMDRNIIKWNPDGYFHPEDPITRAQLAIIIANITGNSKTKTQDMMYDYYDDIANHEWAKSQINACKRTNLIKGTSERTFNPDGKVTYVEFMAIISRIQNPLLEPSGTWPDNYINYAKTFQNQLISDRNITDWNAPISRGDVVFILYKAASKKIAVELTWQEKMEKDAMVMKWRLPDPNKK